MAHASSPVALVTGASRRIGAAMVTHLQQKGYRVMIHYHRGNNAATQLTAMLNQTLSNSAKMICQDLRDPKAAEHLITQTLAQFERLDVVINNASIFSAKDTQFTDMFLCQVLAPYQISQQAFPYLKQTSGNIINITDIHAQIPLRGYGAYCQTKAALLMQTKALALEFAPWVRVNAIAPGATLWPEGENKLSTTQEEAILKKTLLQRHGDAKNIVQAMMYLLENDFVTGQSLNVDGGRYFI